MHLGTLSFDPIADGRYPFTTGMAWGVATIAGDDVTLDVRGGRLDLASLSLRGAPSRRSACDEAALFYAVEGGVGEYFSLVRGQVQLNEKGRNSWVADEKGNEAYVTIIPGQEPKLHKILRTGSRGSIERYKSRNR